MKVNNYTFARYLKEEAGYKVGMFGKYLNTFPQNGYVPPGFDAWLANGGGNYIAPGTVHTHKHTEHIMDQLFVLAFLSYIVLPAYMHPVS